MTALTPGQRAWIDQGYATIADAMDDIARIRREQLGTGVDPEGSLTEMVVEFVFRAATDPATVGSVLAVMVDREARRAE